MSSETKKFEDHFGIEKIDGAHYADLSKVDENLKGFYATNTGYIFKAEDRRFLKPRFNYPGEPVVSINIGSDRTNDGREDYKVSTLVAKIYVKNPDPQNLRYVGYKNGDPTDCSAENLVWTDKAMPSREISKRPLYVICDSTGHIVERCRSIKEAYEASGYNGTVADFSCLFVRNNISFDPRRYQTNFPNGYVTTQEAVDAVTRK